MSFSPITPVKPPTRYSKKITTISSRKNRKALPKPVPEGNHPVKHIPPGKRLSCIFCQFKGKKSRQTRYSCLTCHMALCQFPCFEQYHNQWLYWYPLSLFCFYSIYTYLDMYLFSCFFIYALYLVGLLLISLWAVFSIIQHGSVIASGGTRFSMVC